MGANWSEPPIMLQYRREGVPAPTRGTSNHQLDHAMEQRPQYPGIRVTTNGNQLVSYYTEARVADGGIFYPITPSTEMGEMYQQAFAEGKLNVFGRPKLAIETEG